jgi:hypothetical protein
MLADTRRCMTHEQPKRMLICTKSRANSYTCRHTPSPQYTTTYQDTNTYSTFNTGQVLLVHVKLYAQKLALAYQVTWIVQTHTNTRSALDTANTCGGIMTKYSEAVRHAHSCSAFDTGPHVLNHAQPRIRTNKCRYIQSSLHMQKHILGSRGTCRHTCSSLDTGNWMKLHAQLSKPANKRGTCRRHTLSTCRLQCVHLHA